MTALLLTICATLFTAFACAEAKAWAPHLITRLLALAVRWAPKNLQERMHEEWSAHIAESPGYVAKLLAVLGFAWSARSLAERSPWKVRALLAFVILRMSARLAWAQTSRCLSAKDKWIDLSRTAQLIAITWRLTQPSIAGYRPLSYAEAMLANIAATIKIAADHQGDDADLRRKLKEAWVNPDADPAKMSD